MLSWSTVAVAHGPHQIRHFNSKEDEQQAVDKVHGHRRPTTLKRQHPEPVTSRSHPMPVADIGTSSTVLINEPVNTAAVEVNHLDGPPGVVHEEVNIDLDDMAADTFNFVAAIKTIHSYEVDFIDTIFGNGALPNNGDVNADDFLHETVTDMDDSNNGCFNFVVHYYER